MSKQSYCAECGGHLNDQGEFHPFAFCALVRAGLDPWREVRTIALRLGLEVAEEDGKPLFQNARCGRVFKVGADGEAYDIEGYVFRDPDGSMWTNRESRRPVTFPYQPTTEIVDRPSEED